MFNLQGKDASKPVGNWLQLSMVLFKKEYYQHLFLLASPNFPIMVVPTHVEWL